MNRRELLKGMAAAGVAVATVDPKTLIGKGKPVIPEAVTRGVSEVVIDLAKVDNFTRTVNNNARRQFRVGEIGSVGISLGMMEDDYEISMRPQNMEILNAIQQAMTSHGQVRLVHKEWEIDTKAVIVECSASCEGMHDDIRIAMFASAVHG